MPEKLDIGDVVVAEFLERTKYQNGATLKEKPTLRLCIGRTEPDQECTATLYPFVEGTKEQQRKFKTLLKNRKTTINGYYINFLITKLPTEENLDYIVVPSF